MFKIVVFIPLEQTEDVKSAMFEAGGGRIGNYDCCSFQLEGEGQFRPLKGSNPHIGSLDSIEKVKENRVEMVCSDELIRPVIAAMREAHPYEEPAFDVIKLSNDDY